MDGKQKRVNILGIPFDAVTWEESLKIFEALLLSGNQYQVAKANPEFVMTAQQDQEDFEILNKTAFNTPDGSGILWAATFLALPPGKTIKTLFQALYTLTLTLIRPSKIRKILPQKIGGVEHVVDESIIAAKHGVGVFLLGSFPEARVGAQKYLEKKIPAIKILGDAGSFDPFKDAPILIEKINRSGAGFLIVCFGHPLQEKWIYKNLKNMPNIRVADGEGGTFDYMAGVQKRAPKILQKLNLEWLWRLVTQRGRAKKIVKSVPKFIWAVFKAKLIESRLQSRLKKI